MNNKTQIYAFFDRTGYTLEYSGREKDQILALLRDSRMTISDYGALRKYLFQKAASLFSGNDPVKVLQWLEESVKLLDRVNEPVMQKKPEVYFSPGESCRKRICQAIIDAKSTLDICVFTISDNKISEALLTAQNKGIHIRIITDDDKCYDKGSDIHYLAEKNILIRTDNSPALMHNKFMVVDRTTTITGSYNWTRTAALENGENIVVLHDTDVAETYLKTFEKLWEASVSLGKKNH
ncbi:MAG TPA: phospholipase D-like domain-containing protein [Bacteroidales bacterium]|jgi:phosphatidylserine/phosphatidylglycerophosphate/cardiolipin synthase-like enzyme|nr:DUF1669 domain-containing protein [Bacteroidales bacterium]HPI31207.1 phospholipase D-like domain-containing protein [Bacteroidales bacterium]HQN17333.1 phospholipase D-like domain-containing protein [Bacteroidales bacterium]HQP16862.1 phospholipase D-like domain-containing protein [Bacteroidales bacterium]